MSNESSIPQHLTNNISFTVFVLQDELDGQKVPMFLVC